MASAPESEARHADEARVLAVETAYDQAWSDGDIHALIRCFADGAVLMNPRGEVVYGRDEIEGALGDFLAGPAKGSRHVSKIVRVQFVTEDVAIVDGVATLEGVAVDGSSTITHRFTDVLVRNNLEWRIAQVRAYE